jgi:hypothetical protein
MLAAEPVIAWAFARTWDHCRVALASALLLLDGDETALYRDLVEGMPGLSARRAGAGEFRAIERALTAQERRHD